MASVELQNLPAVESPDTKKVEAQITETSEEVIKGDEFEPAEGSTGVEGSENPAFTQDEEIDKLPPPVTYVDFLPLRLEEAASKSEAPKFAEFSTVIEQANQWIQGNPNYHVMKCEMFAVKFQNEDKVDVECTTWHTSSNGINKYLRGLRLWLVLKTEDHGAIQELGYMTILPEPVDGGDESGLSVFRSNVSLSQFCTISETVEKLNKFLKRKPLPGSILNVETLTVMLDEANPRTQVNTELMSWVECGNVERSYVTAIRVYYVVGKPKFEALGVHDQVPVVQNNFELTSRLRFCNYSTVTERAKKWLKMQKGIKVVNIQTVHVPCERMSSGQASVYSNKAGYTLLPKNDIQFVRVMRLFYVNDPKDETCPYESLDLTTRLFVPSRRDGKDSWGKVCETFSKNMQRSIRWLHRTKVPVFGIETIVYPFTTDTYGSGVMEEKADMTMIRHLGRYNIVTVRMYFPCQFTEPPPDKTEEEWTYWNMCNLS